MRSVSYSNPLIRGLSDYLPEAKLSKADASMGWTVLRLAGWLATGALVVGLVWHITADSPIWSQAIAGLLLVVIGIIAGLRLATRSTTTYIRDVERLNKVLATQNKELESANAILLKELSSAAESKRPSESA
jgi:hypothetical protein